MWHKILNGGNIIMNKTKLGISTSMLAAFIFLLAIVTEFVSAGWVFSMAFVGIVAFVLYKEEDLWLKACAIKAVCVVLVFTLVPFLFGFVNDIMEFINFFLQFADIQICDGFGIMNFFMNIISVVEKVFLLVLALLAFKGKTIKLPVIDKMVAKHLQ